MCSRWFVPAGPILIVGILGLLSVPSSSATEPGSERPPVRIPFAPGEEFRFAVKYGFVRAGEAILAQIAQASLLNTALLF